MHLIEKIQNFNPVLLNLLLYVFLSPIIAYALINVFEWVKSSWMSKSKFKKWFSLTVIILALCIALRGL